MIKFVFSKISYNFQKLFTYQQKILDKTQLMLIFYVILARNSEIA